MRQPTTSPRRFGRGWIYVLAIVAAVAAVMILEPSSSQPVASTSSLAPSPTDSAATWRQGWVVHPEGPKVPAPIVAIPGVLPADYVPRDHYYGDTETFIRQPQDYRNTPERLGAKNGYALYDLERVQDMIRRGMDPDSEFGRLERGPLLEAERRQARAALQSFFDEGTMVVDAVLDGVIGADDAYRHFFRERRQRLNRELRQTLNLSEQDFYTLWPHIRVFAEHIDEIDSIADLTPKS